MRQLLVLIVICVIGGTGGRAQDSALKLGVPDVLDVSGITAYLVPRFSLKTGVRIARVDPAEDPEMRLAANGDGTPVFEGIGQIWTLTHNGSAGAERFLDWLRSDVGRRTIESFSGPMGAEFTPVRKTIKTVATVEYEGDIDAGERLSLSLCGRCHVINEANRMNGMGATPSFAVLRGLRDWDDRFLRFHLLNPHPAFTQIEGVSEPFDPLLPSPIVPVEMSLDDLDAIMAYVQVMDPADLGAPLQFQ